MLRNLPHSLEILERIREPKTSASNCLAGINLFGDVFDLTPELILEDFKFDFFAGNARFRMQTHLIYGPIISINVH